MAWKISRVSGPGDHVLGGTTVTFDAEGVCITDNADVAANARQFPRYFLVEDTSETPPAPPAEEGEAEEPGASPDAVPPSETAPEEGAADQTAPGFTQEDLESLTVTELRELASAADISGASRMTKAELVTALLASQGG
jgi:hypothetical protein